MKFRTLSALVALLSLGGVATDVDAQLIGGKSKGAPEIVALRDETTTVLTVLASKDATVVVFPVPKDAKPVVVTTNSNAVTRALLVSAPRIVEQWEQDPCEFHSDFGPPGPPVAATPGPNPAPKKELPVKAHVTLPSEKTELLAALDKLGVQRDEHMDAAITRYLSAGYSFISVPLQGRTASIALSAERFELPTDLLKTPRARVLAVTQRERVAPPGDNFGSPTSLLVDPRARTSPTLFHQLVQAAIRPPSSLTEYAWTASQCDGCEAPLTGEELSALGLSAWPAAKTAGEVLVRAEAVSDEPGGPDELREALTKCATTAAAAGEVIATPLAVEVKVADGKTTAVDPKAQAYGTCVTSAVVASELDKSGTLTVEWRPLSRAFLKELVLTRLDLPVDATAPTVLERRPPIEGGRENGPNGKPEARAFPAEGANNYQTLYVVQHPWKSAVKCAAPQRGVFAPTPPKGWKRGDGKKLAAADDVKSLITDGLPALTAFQLPGASTPAKPPKDVPATPSPSASTSAAPSAAASGAPATPPPEADGCGCSTPPQTTRHASLLAALSASLLLRRRRARRS